jgi:tetratricopeptide (TPR) repeat protein
MPMHFTLISLSLMLVFLACVETRAQSLQSVDLHGNDNTVIQIIFEVSQGDPDFLRKNEARITKLAEKLGVSNALIVNFLGKIDEGDVSREKWPEILAKVAEDYVGFQVSAALLAASDPIAKDLIDKAKIAAELTQFAEADQLLIEAEAKEEAARDKIKEAERQRQLNLVSLKAIRAQNYMIQQRYVEAAVLYERAASLAEGVNGEKQIEMLRAVGDAYLRQGDEKGDNASLEKAIVNYRDELLPLIPRNVRALDWAQTQNNLALALQILGERDGGTEKLRGAISSYRETLDVWAHSQAPLEWARTYDNLGNALESLAMREGGTALLEDAAAAHIEALKVRTRESAPLDWALSLNNLGVVLWNLGVRENNAERFEQALRAYDQALEEFTRERAPRSWAMTQNNKGLALWALGVMRNNNSLILRSASAFQLALGERRRELAPLDWAQTQNNLGEALWILGRSEKNTLLLDRALAAYREALQERSRERVPLDWARSQRGIGKSLLLLGTWNRSKETLLDAKQAVALAASEFRAKNQWHDEARCLSLMSEIEAALSGF